jgi:long-chain fatty acid transport protein
MRFTRFTSLILTALAVPLLATALSAQTGHVLNGVGAVNQSMAGASTAESLDASGALQWNPAALAGLRKSSIQFGMEVLIPDVTLESSVSAPVAMSGSSSSDMGASPIPSFGFAYKIPDSAWTFGFGAFGLSGFGVEYQASNSNPILMPPPNGFGSIVSEFQLMQLAPSLAYQVDDDWAVGFAPTIDRASLRLNPGCFAAPDDADGDGFPTYPSALNGATAWGFGGQVGVTYRGIEDWSFGASYKTQQTFGDFEFNSVDELGNYRAISLDMDFPAILSLGTAYRGMDQWLFALDVRYIDYESTDGFGPATFNPDGSVAGFGWDSILVLALGAQYAIDECLSVRAGYAYNENPVPDANSTFNVPAPAIIQHHASLGMSYCVGKDWFVDVAYRRGFENSIEGPMGHPSMGPIPGSNVKNTMSTDSVIVGFRVEF